MIIGKYLIKILLYKSFNIFKKILIKDKTLIIKQKIDYDWLCYYVNIKKIC